MQQQTNDWHFSRKTRTGALVLLALLLILVILWRLLPSMIAPKEDPEHKALQGAWDQFKKENLAEEHETDRADEHRPAHGQRYDKEQEDRAWPEKTGVTVRLVPFDPNTAGEEELVALGFKPWTAKTIIRFRSKGGIFRKKEDLQKLYTLSKEDYERIAPYARFGEPQQDKPAYAKEQPAYARPEPSMTELNSVDADGLLSLRGIGPAFSRRILNFRNALGGFVSTEQLKEVYGFPDSTYQQLRGRLTADIGKVRKINLNTATEEELGKHPYMGRKAAAEVIKLRNKLGNFSQIEQIKQVPLINEEKYRKIAPYLSTH